MEILHGSSCLEKVKESFSELLFGKSGFYICVNDGCRQQTLFQLSDRVYSLKAEIQRLSLEERYIHNDISVARIWGEIDGYDIPILVLLEKLTTLKVSILL